MNKISGIVLNNSYYYKNCNDKFIINFPFQVDRKVSIFGQIMVHLTSPLPLEFKPGRHLTIKGDIFYENGCRINIENYQISL